MTYDLFSQFEIHQRESSPSNERVLENGREHFSNNCRILFEEFMKGKIINTFNSPVPEFRRRRQDLTDENGVHLHEHPTSSGRLKNWYMTEDDKKYNQKFQS